MRVNVLRGSRALVFTAVALSTCTAPPPLGTSAPEIAPDFAPEMASETASEIATVVASPSPTPPAAAPSPPPPPPPPPAPFQVVVQRVHAASVSNAGLLGHPVPAPDPQAVTAAVEAGRQTVQDYLNTQFFEPSTRFSAHALAQLLTPTAAALLTPQGRVALGQVALPVTRVAPGPAAVNVEVSADGGEVVSILALYETRFTVAFPGTAAPLLQRGALLLVPTDQGWRADVADVFLDLSHVPLQHLPAEAAA